MPTYRLKDTGGWRKLAEIYRLKDTGNWRKLNRIYRLRSDGTWRRVFSSLGLESPTIENTVEISRSGQYHNSSNIVTLTGKKYHFANATTFEYRFYSSSDQNNWNPLNNDWVTTSNPASGASSNVTYQLTNDDFTSTTMYFQFRYRATNSSNVTTVSISTPVSVTYLEVPAPPPGFPDINQSTISVSSTASSGTWTGSPILYQWKWQYGASNNTLTYQATPSISSISLSGTTATATVFNHGFKSGDTVTVSGVNALFNQSSNTISSVFTNLFSYTISKPAHVFSTNYSAGQFVTYGGQIYISLLATPTPRAAWSSTTSYTTGQYVNHSAQLWRATGPSLNQTPIAGSDFWELIDIYPTSTTYWQSQQGSTASGGTATGPNYHEGSSSSPISYTISSFPSTDYKTGTALQGLTTRMNVTASNVAFTSSAYNSSARTIYGYPLIVLGTNTLTPTSASIVYSEANMDVYDLNLRRSVSVTSATVSGSNIIYTTSVPHSFSSSALVQVTGMSPSTFNISDIVVVSVGTNTFTITNTTGATGSSTAGGTALGTVSGYPSNNRSNSSPISITGLSSGSTYTAYITPKNADSPRVSGIQRTTTFTTPSPPVNTAPPTIGPLNNRSYLPVSTVLTATTGTWTNVNANTTYNYNFQYFESAQIGWVSLQSSSSSNYTAPSNYTTLYGTQIRCVVTATNSDGANDSATSIAYNMDQAVVVGTITPTSVTQNTSTNFSFAISHYPTSYVINWGDSTTDHSSGSITANTATVNASVAHTYTTAGTYTITVTAQPGDKTNTASITVAQPAPGPVRNLTRVAAALSGVATDKRFNWDAPNTGGSVTGYQFKINSGAWTSTGQGTNTFVELFNFNTGISNTVSIRAVGPGGSGTESSSGPFTLPIINTGPTASSIAASSVTIGWTSSNQSSYSLAIPGAPSTPYTGTTQTSRTVSSLSSGTSYTATVTITSSSSDTHAKSVSFTTLFTGLTPTFGTNTRTSDGFTGSVTNYSTSYTFSGSTSVGTFTWGTASGSTRPFTVTGVSAGTSATVTVTTTRSGYESGSNTTTESALNAALTPTFGTNTRGDGRIDGSVTNYSTDYTFSGSASVGTFAWGTASGSTRPFSVTGLNDNQSTTVTVTTTRSGYASGSGTTTASSLAAGLTPTFGANTSGTNLFAGSVTNYNTDYTWSSSLSPSTATFTWGSLPGSNPGTRTFTVGGLSAGESATLTLTTSRAGFKNGSASTTGSAAAGLTAPGTPTMTYDSANSTASNWAYDIRFTPSSGTGTIQYQLECRGPGPTPTTTVTRPSTAGTYYATNIVSNLQEIQNVLLARTINTWQCRARATNNNGSTFTAWSDWSTFV